MTDEEAELVIRELRKDLRRMAAAYLAAVKVIEEPGLRIMLLEMWSGMEPEAEAIVQAVSA